MSLMQKFIDLEQKVENALREVRVGFPEGAKQQLLAWGSDVSEWMSIHHMEVILSLAAALVLMGIAFIAFFSHKNKAQLQLIASLQDRKDYWADRSRYWWETYLEEVEECRMLHSKVSELEEKLEDALEEADSQKIFRDLAEANAEVLEDKVSELQEEVETLKTLADSYNDLVEKLDAAHDTPKAA